MTDGLRTESTLLQRLAADPAASVWVSANAGAGKTLVLTDRVIKLMLAGTPPGRLLCLTFTKAAAAEMANRVFDRLGAWVRLNDQELADALMRLLGADALTPELIARARRLFAEALEAPGGLKIQTIHAFCESLLRRFPLEARIAPHFEVIDERSAAEYLEAARDTMLARASSDEVLRAALEVVITVVDEHGFGQLMGELAFKRSHLQKLIRRHGGEAGLIAATRELLGLKPGEAPHTITEEACRDGAFDGGALAHAVSALRLGGDKDRERADAIEAFIVGDGDRHDVFERYVDVFLTKKHERRAESRLITKRAREAAPAALDTLLNEQDRLYDALTRRRAAVIAERTSAIIIVGAALLEAYEREKALNGRMDYGDLVLRARDMLLEGDMASWVLFKLDGGIDHILVDEAQDTSPEQWQVIAALAEEFFAGVGAREAGRTVFAVGDEKQSIYSFQGADPTQFDKMRRHFADRVEAAGQIWRSVGLIETYRSVGEILDAVDRVFSGDTAREGLTSGDGPIRHLPFIIGKPGLVELWPTVVGAAAGDADPWDAPLDNLSAASPPAELARRIVDTIASWLASGERLPARRRPERAERPIRPGDVMVLVRRRNEFVDYMVRELKQRGIAVAGSDRLVLTDQIAVMDLIALGEFLLLPEDDLTLAAVLKSPLIGLDEDGLFELAHGRPGTLWQSLRNRRQESPRYLDAASMLDDLLSEADFTRPFEFYSELLGARRGRARLLDRLGPDAIDPLDEFLSLALAYERTATPSLQGFLHWVRAGQAEIKRDLELERDEVRIMTVHGAKGLEAPIVFLPDTCTTPGGRHDPRLLSASPAAGAGRADDLLLWQAGQDADDPVTSAARERARAEALREHHRLLYVAMTRAEDRLYVCGYEKTKRHEGCWYDLIAGPIRAAAEEIPLPTGETGWRIGGPAPTGAPEREVRDEAPTSPADWAERPAPREPVPSRPLAPSRTDEEPPVASPLDGGARARAFQRGNLIHKLLQTTPELPPATRWAAAGDWLAAAAPGLDAATREALLSEVRAIVEAPENARLFGPESRAEVPITGVIGDVVVSGQIDRLAITDDEIVIVDYKTNRPPPESAEAVPRAYLRQMALYRAVIAGMYEDRPIRTFLLWTYGPRIMHLPTEVLYAAMA